MKMDQSGDGVLISSNEFSPLSFTKNAKSVAILDVGLTC